jgi:hypothetical protein
MFLTAESMQAYIEKQRLQGPASTSSTPPFVTSDIVDAVQKALKKIKPFDSWHDVQDRPESEQKDLWLFREWLHCEIALHVANTIERSKDTVQFGDKRRKIPPGFKIGDYKILSFGSLSITSDIDMTIDGPKGSFIVACVEDAWYEITGHTSRIWDIEYYGDFLMFHNGSDFINSRTFGAEEDATKIHLWESGFSRTECLSSIPPSKRFSMITRFFGITTDLMVGLPRRRRYMPR